MESGEVQNELANMAWGKKPYTTETIMDLLTIGINDPDVDQGLKDIAAGWLNGGRPDYEEAKRYASSWTHEINEYHGIPTKISKGLNRAGATAVRHFFGEARVSEETFKTLICSQQLCPRHQLAWKNWSDFVNRNEKQARKVAPPTKTASDAPKEQTLLVGGKTYFARPAKLSCLTPCPTGAHAPIEIQRDGWDIFDEQGTYISGGLDKTRPLDDAYPKFPNIRFAQQWLEENVSKVVSHGGKNRSSS
jgi:hypothetical protein